MTAADLSSTFNKFAKTAIKNSDDGYYLYGHNVNVQTIGETWDVYLCNQRKFVQGDRTAYLGTKKLNNILATLPKSVQVHQLDGEAWFNTTNLQWLKSWLFENHKALGVRLAGHKTSSSFRCRS